jgi:dipeptidyl aminopeptidase/acylaminoacyl peptidase
MKRSSRASLFLLFVGLVVLILAVSGCSAVDQGLAGGETASPTTGASEKGLPTPTSAIATPRTVTGTPVAATPTEGLPPAELAFVRDGDLWVSGVSGDGPQKLTSSGNISAPTWSSDGRALAFVKGQGLSAVVGVVQVDGGQVATFGQSKAANTDPAWSPDGRTIAYTVQKDTNGDSKIDIRDSGEIWLMNADGSNQHRLADGYQPAWSPDGRNIVFVSNGQLLAEAPYRQINSLMMVDAAGKGEKTILPVKDVPTDLSKYNYPFNPATILLQHPAWSPDGRSIAFSTVGHTGLIGICDTSGENLSLVGFNYEGGFGRVAWAPTGNAIAAESFPASGTDHVVIRDTTSGKTADVGKESTGPSVTGPTWSPDGRHLALVGVDGGSYLATVAADGSGFQRLIAGAFTAVVWNPTSKS